MKDLLDIHTHSRASRHAHSTLYENICQAKDIGLKYYGLSDHAPGMPNTTCEDDFHNFKCVPRSWGPTTFVYGAEVNILDDQGTIDLQKRTTKGLDYIIASLHPACMEPHDKEYNTRAYINTMKHYCVNIIGHPDDGHYEFDQEAVIKAAKENHKLIELNNSSLRPDSHRLNSKEIMKENLRLCMKYQQPIIMSSDAHFMTGVGDHSLAIKLLKEVGFPDELVVNYNQNLINEYLGFDKLKVD